MNRDIRLTTVIVDDNKEFRLALRMVFDLFDEIEVINEYNNGKEFIESLDKEIPDLVFMDIEMPEMNGIEATRKAIIQFPQMKIIGLSFHNQFEYIQQILFAGANNYIIKDELDHVKIQNIIKNLINLTIIINN